MTLRNINSVVAGLSPYKPGKPIEELSRELGLTDIVKLAREYSDGVSRDPEKRKVAASLLQVAAHTGSQPLAEGVEHKEDADYLADMGYELFQGYYFARPQEQPLDSLPHTVNTNH